LWYDSTMNSAFELQKNTAATNAASRLQATPLVGFGRIVQVIDIQTVIVEAAVQVSLSREQYTITLLDSSSLATIRRL